MRRMRNLALFGIGTLVVLIGFAWSFRAQLAPFLGVNLDAGAGGRAELVLPEGFAAEVFAEGLNGPRFMAVSPAGVLFVAERGADRIVALPDADGDGVADEVVEIGAGYGNAHDIEFTDEGSLLVAGQAALFEVTLDSLRETDRRTLIDDLPTGGHSTKTVVIVPEGPLLSIGSSCDACLEEDERRAAVSLVDPASGHSRVVMRGLRNAVGLWVDPETGRIWATSMGRDQLGDDRPPETLYEVIEGTDAGWPRCHGGTIRDPDFGESDDACDGVAAPAATFPAHTAPLALVGWKDHLVIALHGSWNSSTKVGYALWWLPWDGEPAGDPEPFVTGFLPEDAPDAPDAPDALGRPAGLAVGADGSLYVSDDKAGFIYRISRAGP